MAEDMWEFEAPQFVDFSAPIPMDDNADEWFDCVNEEREKSLSSSRSNSRLAQTPKSEEKRKSERKILKDNDVFLSDQNGTSSESEMPPPAETKIKIPANLVTSLSSWKTSKPKRCDSSNRQVSELRNGSCSTERHSPRIAAKHGRSLSNQSRSVRAAAMRQSRSPGGARRSPKVPVRRAASTGTPAAKKRRMADSKQNISAHSESLNSSNTTANTRKAAPVVKGPPKITIPNTPTFMRKKAHKGGEVKSSEQLELERIADMRRKLVEKKKLAQASYKEAQASHGPIVLHSKAELTRPVEFHFETDSRVKVHNMETRQDKQDFETGLRQYNQPMAKPHKGITVSKPFSLSDNRKRKLNRESDGSEKQEGHKFTSMAEKVLKFQTRTPERFRNKAKEHVLAQKKVSPKVTVPKTPQFETRTRKRPVTAVSQSEVEEKEIEEMKQYAFKATKLDQRIFNNPSMGVKKVASKNLTEPKPFDFETDRRLQETKNKSRDEKEEEKEEMFKARPLPHTGIVFQPKLNHEVTQPKPFTCVEAHTQEMMTRKEKKIQQALEEERKAREFYAQPLPSDSPKGIPSKPQVLMTEPEPFNLESDQRGAKRAEKWAQELRESLKREREAKNFKAKPSKVLHEAPFVPKKSNKSLTDVSNIALNTERRVEERMDFEMYKKEKEIEHAQLKQMKEREREEEDKAEIARLRKEMVHKSNPVRKFNSIEIAPSDKPLTEPKTPRFSKRTRKV